MITAYVTTGTWAADRWWMALSTGLILVALLMPWSRLVAAEQRPRFVDRQIVVALIFALCAHHIDLIQSSWVPYGDLATNDQFQARLGWTNQQINNVHSLGSLFTMVPVVLASWRFGIKGMFGSLGLAGLLYVSVPLVLPPDAFNWWFYAVRGFVLLGVTLILSFVVGTLASSQRRKQRELATLNQQLAQQAAMMDQLATSRERNRLARELHDTLAHSLSGTAVQLQAVGTLMKVDTGAASAELKNAQQQIKSGLSEARRAIAALRSSSLEELGLAEALTQRAANLAERIGIPVTTTIDPLPTIPPLTEQTLYRVADEALVNAEKYAQAKQIALTLTHKNGMLRLSIEDDGVGFDVNAVDSAESFGILGLHERAALIQANLAIDSKVGQGTHIELVAPI